MQTPSAYQEKVFHHLENRLGNSAVISVAGSGKTWTAIEGVGRIPSVYSKMLGTFTTNIRDDFKKRGEERGFKNTKYVTYNSFGWGICLYNLKHKPELDKEKTEHILEFVTMQGAPPEKLYKYTNPIKRIVSLFKALDIHTVEEANSQYNEIVDHHNMQTPDDPDFQQTVISTFQECLRHQDHYDYDDQKYMPLHLGLPIPRYDQVLLDEFQDSSPLEMRLMLEAAKGGQFCAIGDPDQSIYGFKASTPDAFPKYIRENNAKELYLSICYRCPKSVIREAQSIVPRIEWGPDAIEGCVDRIEYTNFQQRVRPRDMVLCRVTDELVKECLALIRIGVPGKIRGRDFGDSLSYIIDKVSNKRSMPIADFITGLYDYQIKRSEQLRALRRDAEILSLEDRCNTIRALGEQASHSDAIKVAMSSIFTDDPHNGVDFMTCHKSKGLQRKNVFVLRPDLLPHPRAKEREWMMAEERRLKYVTITRAEENLFWVNKKK